MNNTDKYKTDVVKQVQKLQNFYDGVLYLMKNNQDINVKNLSEYSGISKRLIYRSMQNIH